MNISPHLKKMLKKRALSVVVPVLLIVLSPAMFMVGVIVGALWLTVFTPAHPAQSDIFAYPLVFGLGFGAISFAIGTIWLAISLIRLRLWLMPVAQIKRRLR